MRLLAWVETPFSSVFHKISKKFCLKVNNNRIRALNFVNLVCLFIKSLPLYLWCQWIIYAFNILFKKSSCETQNLTKCILSHGHVKIKCQQNLTLKNSVLSFQYWFRSIPYYWAWTNPKRFYLSECTQINLDFFSFFRLDWLEGGEILNRRSKHQALRHGAGWDTETSTLLVQWISPY